MKLLAVYDCMSTSYHCLVESYVDAYCSHRILFALLFMIAKTLRPLI
jgi:hypothetical protein